MNRLLALGLALASTLALGDVKTCTLSNNKLLEDKFRNRSFEGFFRSNGNAIKTLVSFSGDRGLFKRQGLSTSDSLFCIRYLTVDQALDLSQSLNAGGLDLSVYFDTSSCDVAILADWAAGNSRGRVLWCTTAYSSGSAVQGVYWQDSDWSNSKFTDVWEGRWK